MVFNNISAIFWQSILLVEETEVPGENYQPVASHWQTLSHNVASSTPRPSWIQTHVSGDRPPSELKIAQFDCSRTLFPQSTDGFFWCIQSVPWAILKISRCLPMVGGSLSVLWLLPPLKLVAMIELNYCWKLR